MELGDKARALRVRVTSRSDLVSYPPTVPSPVFPAPRGTIDGELVDRHGVDRGHEPLHDAEVVVQHLPGKNNKKRSKAIKKQSKAIKKQSGTINKQSKTSNVVVAILDIKCISSLAT